METLREIRTKFGITATEVAQKTNIATSALSKYESGLITPNVEDMVVLERTFGQEIDWSANEKISEEAKQNIVRCINVLTERYPLLSVLRFIDEGIRTGQKLGEPDKVILHFTKVSQSNYDPLYPDDVITG